MNSFSLPVRIYIEDTDAAGIVYYVNYLKFMERARTEMLRHLDFGHYLHYDDFLFVVRSANVRYRQPAKMDDALQVSATLLKRGKASLLFAQTVERDGELLCEAEISIACVDKTTLKPRSLPTRLIALLD